MTQSALIEKLSDIINQQNVAYFGIIVFVIGFFTYFQWRISDRYMQQVNDKIRKLRKTAKSLNESNRLLSQYVLDVMSKEGYLEAKTPWERKASMYIHSKKVNQLKTTRDLFADEDLEHAKNAVLFAFKDRLENIIRLNNNQINLVDLGDQSFTKQIATMNDCFIKKEPEYPDYLQEIIGYNRHKLHQLGNELTNEKAKQLWFSELKKFNRFWILEKLPKHS